ncbi:MAG: hypothetical protein AB1778_03840 [Candidatus Bipolaricaulota bacterium]
MVRRGVGLGWILLSVCLFSLVAGATCTTIGVAPQDDDSHEGLSWDNGMGGRVAEDGEWASTDLNGDEHEFDDYPFTGLLPIGAIITGFEVRIRGFSSGGPGSVQVGLSWDGGGQVDKPAGASPWTVSLPTGSGADATWNSVEIENPPFIHEFARAEVCGGNETFTVWVKANVGGDAIYVDAVEVRVTYYDETVPPFTPNNPTPSSSSHVTGTWYNASTLPDPMVTVDWTSATDRPTCDSGIDGYRAIWDTSSSTNLGASDGFFLDEEGVHSQDFSLGNGQYWFHIRSVDNVGNLADATSHLGPFRYDDLWPTNPNVTSTKSTGWSNTAIVPIAVSGASDTLSGIDGFAIAWTHSGTWTPDGAKDREEVWGGETFTMAADGLWYFHLIAVDNAGNWAAAGSDVETLGWFGVDTHAPSDPTATSPTHIEGGRSNNPNVQIGVSGASDPTHGEPGYEMASGVDGFSVGWDHNAAGVPDATKDEEQGWPGTTYNLADGTWYFHLRTVDNAGNWTSTETFGPVTIDTEDPTVTTVVASDTLITDADTPGNATFTITVDFSEPMNTGIAPSLSFNPAVATTLTLDLTSGWSDSDTYVARYDVADGNARLFDVAVDVSGAQDVAGNEQENYAPQIEFEVDTLNPTVSSVVASDALISDADTPGDASFTVTIDFDDAMNTGVVPTVSLNPTVASTLSLDGTSGWADANTYVARYDTADANVDVDSVTVDVSGVRDAAGNDQQDYTPVHEFAIDTLNPTVSIGANDVAIYDGDVGVDRFVVTATYSESMDPAVTPSLVFLPGMATTFTNPSGAWSVGNTVYTWTYDVVDDGAAVADIDLMVSGAADVAGNTQILSVRSDYIDVDLRNPTVVIAANDVAIYDGDVGVDRFAVTATFSEAMNPAVVPTLTFTPAVATTLTNPSGAWSVGNTVYTWTYDVSDAGVTVADVDVTTSGGQDVAGNVQVSNTNTDYVDIDTQNPTVASVVASDTLITDADTPGDATFTITVDFSEAMNTGIAPTVSFSPVVAPTLTLDGTSGWADADTYVARYDVADGNVDVNDVAVDVAGAQDAAGNGQQDYAAQNEFGIDTLNPTVTSVTASDTLIADADAGQTRYVTANFSEAMDQAVTPVFTFAPDVASTLTHTGGLWQTTTRYRASYLAVDAGVDVDSVTVDVTGTRDEAGNAQQDYAPQNEFAIDTLNPTVLSIALSDNLITDADVGGTFTVTIDYSEPMQSGVAPTVVFDPALDTTFSLLLTSGWSDGDTYVARYAVLDGNVTVDDDDVQVSAARDLAGNVQIPSSLDNDLDIDTENPIISNFVVTGGPVGTKNGNDCVREVTFVATVTDPNGRMDPGDIVITSATVPAGNAQIGVPYDVVRTAVDVDEATIEGVVDVYDLTGCPAFPRIVLDATDLVGNEAAQAWAEDDVYDLVIPTINDFTFHTDDTYTTTTDEYEVDGCCVTTVYFSANVTDNCCIDDGNVSVSVSLPTLNAILENVWWEPTQAGQKRVDLVGHADVRCVTSCPARVEVVITAHDCCGNDAVPVTSGAGTGLVYDRMAPEPSNDPDGYEASRCDGLEVRRDNDGQYRLMIRENTPTYIDVLCNDTDNCSRCACCGTLWIHDIVEYPEYATLTIVDDEGDCSGGTSLRFAPDRGYLGPDRFTYRIVDACGNISDTATAYTETIREVDVEDVFAVGCAASAIRITVEATDLWVDPGSPDLIPFGFSILQDPAHGLLWIDPASLRYTPPSTTVDPLYGVVPTMTFTESAAIDLVYTPAADFEGRDAFRVLFSDPYGGRTVGRVDVAVTPCGSGEGTMPGLEVSRGRSLALIMPLSFDPNRESGILLVSLEDGMPFAAGVETTWSERVGRTMVWVDASEVPEGDYRLELPLGNGEVVSVTIAVVGEGE